ncbi:MAG: T9SS type A sorting domain-containing protein [Ignavibacterium sp.]|nr:T9SS type A sorting domain-containing protein [Ignavibacterium sp.]
MKKLSLIFVVIFITSSAYAQWYQISFDSSSYSLYQPKFVNSDIGWLLAFDENPPNTTTIYNTTNGGINWIPQFNSYAPIISNFYLDENNGWFTKLASAGAVLYYTSNGGTNWVIRHSGFEFFYDIRFFDLNNGIAVGSSGAPQSGAIFKTSDGGITWQVVLNNDYSIFYCCEFINPLVGWCASQIVVDSSSILKTIDGGLTWTELPSPEFSSIRKMKFFNELEGWILLNGNFYKTVNGGISWDLKFTSITDFSFVDSSNGWYLSQNKIYHSTDEGENWVLQYANPGNSLANIFFLNSNDGWVSGRYGLLLKTINGGIPVELISFSLSINENDVTLNWATATETNNQGFEIERKSANSNYEKIGFVAGFGTTTERKSYSFLDENVATGSYLYRLKQIDYNGTFEYSKSIEVIVDITPTEFALNQNYPNPFNPSTTIKYSISSSEFVSIKVYDVIGNEIAKLVDVKQDAGKYEVSFDASTLSSGVYLYKIQAGSFVQTKKMILMK